MVRPFRRTRAGQLHERVEFQRRAYVSDGYGNEQANFETVFETRAGFNLMRGSESVIASRLTGVQPMTVTLRSTVNARSVRPDWRMVDVSTGKLYAIQSVMQDFDDKSWVDMIVTEGVAA
jgi:head-tail adaptor